MATLLFSTLANIGMSQLASWLSERGEAVGVSATVRSQSDKNKFCSP